ncbi:hypothetical protein AAVH_22945 [Aphelenchoides avenae]|nr:hypothetical protein AAVH_22945 [Aphelenchus avenae]
MRFLTLISCVLFVEARWKLTDLNSGEEEHHRKHHHHDRHEEEEEHGCYWTCPPRFGFEGCGTPYNGVGYPVVCPNTEYCAKFISYGGEDETGVILPLIIR